MPRDAKVIRTASAQADTGQTDLIQTPAWAKYAIVYLNVTAATGTTPLTDMKFQYVHPGTTNALDMQWDGITQIEGTTTGHVVVVIGAHYDTADDTTPVYFIKDPLPFNWNIVLTLDRTSSNEEYTYSLACEFIG